MQNFYLTFGSRNSATTMYNMHKNTQIRDTIHTCMVKSNLKQLMAGAVIYCKFTGQKQFVYGHQTDTQQDRRLKSSTARVGTFKTL